MLAHQRQELILDAVRAHGGVRVADLVERLGVSEMTVRRDIGELSRQGLVARVHGGAAALGRSSEEPGFAAKSTLRTDAKRAVARAALRFAEPGASVALSAGTTTAALAAELPAVPGLTVLTNSPRVADLLHGQGPTVIQAGGVRTPSDALVGPVARASLTGLHVDVLFLGVHGLDVRAGLTTPNLLEADTNRALMDCAARVVVVADASKHGVVGLTSFAGLDAVDVLVTDDTLDPTDRTTLADHVGELVIAEPLEDLR
ncbi:DeoR/GlpR family DNA-binding transcription regulator [Kineococcus rhizosphaerae]|uniref:DeoR family transcriptional regulator n=1 Tax=Kineococcus rhizosphaerae TaxID=559628 RepID=A0A2T0R1K0_9ACTN|nr:DeoR/GlpR family DNA-binding transcription regulator [Kineococcus rhizosphaerae]PRY13438.1 DeoR family transcriptional regulator [Kineococcus rhizosphaerae]